MLFRSQHPELFGDRVVGAALLSTLAGGMRSHRIFGRLLPDRLMSAITPRVVAGLARAPELVESVRRAGSNVGFLVTDRWAFGDDVPAGYVEFVDEMLSSTPFDVVADFFPTFGTLDKFETVHAMSSVPVAIVCGTDDKITPIGHSRKLHANIPGSTLLECEKAGHMVILERHDQVNAELDQLLAAAAEAVDRR